MERDLHNRSRGLHLFRSVRLSLRRARPPGQCHPFHPRHAWRTVAVGLAFQVTFAALVLRWSVGRDALDFVAGQVTVLIDYTNDGVEFLFGKLVADEQATIFALQVLPVIIFLAPWSGCSTTCGSSSGWWTSAVARSPGCWAPARSSRCTRPP